MIDWTRALQRWHDQLERKLDQAQRRSVIFRWFLALNNGWNESLTRTGRYVVTGAVATAIAGGFPEHMIGSFLFSCFAALIAAAGLLSLFHRPKVQVALQASSRCVAGGSISLRLEVSNTSRRVQRDLGACLYRLPRSLDISPDPQYLARLEPNQRHAFTYALRTRRRGSYLLGGPSVYCAAPLGLTQARRFYNQPHRLIVYPAFQPLRELRLPVGPCYQPGGLVLTSKVGDSMEFIGTREYQMGDRLRDLHPRSWARLGIPVVKQYQEEYLTRVALLVDTHASRRDEESFEAGLSLAAAIAEHLARQEHVVDLLAAGPELYHFQAGRSLGYLDNILDILACVESCPRDPLETLAPRLYEEIRSIATVVAVFQNWNAARQAMVNDLLQRGVMVKAVVVSRRSPEQSSPGVAWYTPQDVRQGIEVL